MTHPKGGGVLGTGTTPPHQRGGGLRHGQNPIKGGLGHGHESKRGVLGTGTGTERGGGGVLRTGLVKTTILVTDVAQKGVYLLITLTFLLST